MGYLTKWKVGSWGIQSQPLDRVHPNSWQILSSYSRHPSQWWICGRGHGRFGGGMPKQPLQMLHAWQSNNIPCEPTLVSLNTNQWGLLRPVYTLRFVGPICRPDSVGAQIVRVFWHPIYRRFVKTKIGPIQKICCSATDFCVVGPTLSKKLTCRSKFWAESMRINQKQSKWRTRRLRRGQSRAVSKRKKSPFW